MEKSSRTVNKVTRAPWKPINQWTMLPLLIKADKDVIAEGMTTFIANQNFPRKFSGSALPSSSRLFR
jgi:hypothetical protein